MFGIKNPKKIKGMMKLMGVEPQEIISGLMKLVTENIREMEVKAGGKLTIVIQVDEDTGDGDLIFCFYRQLEDGTLGLWQSYSIQQLISSVTNDTANFKIEPIAEIAAPGAASGDDNGTGEDIGNETGSVITHISRNDD